MDKTWVLTWNSWSCIWESKLAPSSTHSPAHTVERKISCCKILHFLWNQLISIIVLCGNISCNFISIIFLQTFHIKVVSFSLLLSYESNNLFWSHLFVCLVGFLAFSSTIRLYRGRAPRQSVWQFYMLPHMRQSWETMTSVSAGHIIMTPTQPVGSGRPQRESNQGPPHQESSALPTELPRSPFFFSRQTKICMIWSCIKDQSTHHLCVTLNKSIGYPDWQQERPL